MSAVAVRRRMLPQTVGLLLCVAGLLKLGVGVAVPVKAAVAQLLLERAFDRSIGERRARKPWAWADMTPVARLRVPRLGVERIVLSSGSGQALAFGPTLLPGGASLDAPGTAVIAAHRDTHFRFLAQVHIGDLIQVETAAGSRRYRISSSAVVHADRFGLRVASAGQHLALITCFPFGAIAHGPLRYVVTADAIA